MLSYTHQFASFGFGNALLLNPTWESIGLPTSPLIEVVNNLQQLDSQNYEYSRYLAVLLIDVIQYIPPTLLSRKKYPH